MAKRGEKTRAGNTWSEARYFSFIRSALRRAYSRYPVKFAVLAAAKRNKPATDDGRHKYEYQCFKCKQWHMQKNVEVDHITPCGSLKTYSDLPRFVETLFCEEDNLRCVCKPCHKKITAKEKKK